MNPNILVVAALAVCTMPVALAADVTDHRVWQERYPVTTDSPQLVVSNIWGNVTVSAGPPGEITVSVDERRSAPTQALFDRSLLFLGLEIDADASGVSMVVGGKDREWRDLNACRGCRVDYQLELRVPPGAVIDVSTVMDGRVEIDGISGPVSASNVNGPIAIASMHDCSQVESVNGSVDLTFSAAPSRDCRLETINGDITMGLPGNTGLDVALDLFNGRVVSEFDVDPLAMPAQIDQFEEDGSYRYRIAQPAGVRLGGGGPLFSFSSMNGDIQIEMN